MFAQNKAGVFAPASAQKRKSVAASMERKNNYSDQ